MISVILGQGMSLAEWTKASASSSLVDTSEGSTRFTQGVRLSQVNPDKTDTDTDIDIIAIHGFDTKSPDTWTWKDPRDPKNEAKWVNWLQHPDMLPKAAERVRIFTCDWPADLLQPADLVQKRIDEYAILLLDGIQRQLLATMDAREDRPVFFIASCLGGLILAKALMDADEDHPLRRVTRGIVFLATPFRGTSFQDVAAWAEPGLKAWASIQGREANKLLNSVKGPTLDLEGLVRTFTLLCQGKDNPCHVFNFYEKGKTSLPRKIFPWLPIWFYQDKQLVNESSATLDIVPYPLPLDQPHVLMNKFYGPGCADYKKVAGKIQQILGKIREGTLLAQADAWIRRQCYTPDRLKIERLSGEELQINRCYINLAIVEQPKENTDGPESSPFSLPARLKVETPDEKIQVALPTIFNMRTRDNGETIQPRRILIRGRAGVGKTTLCKKIVHEFTHGKWSDWSKLFDRVLWAAGYNFDDLFYHEYFSRQGRDYGYRLAKELRQTLDAKSSKSLFLLDGLDEILQDWNGETGMSCFIKQLLNILPPITFDLEVETIGFYPLQVEDYIKMAFSSCETSVSFLEKHWLEKKASPNSETKLDTMTALYQAIELSLWKKDIPFLLKLKLSLDDTLVRLSFLRTSDPLLEYRNRNYHFLHLTFQEYFAARYFLNQPEKRLIQRIEPATFLAEHKYMARYDILWRFVAGLLDAEGKVKRFFDLVGEEPLDLLGLTHQQLVMHCLSEKSLSQWLLFECNFNWSAYLASEDEFPERALHDTLQKSSNSVKGIILNSLSRRRTIPFSVLTLAVPWLENKDRGVSKATAYALGSRSILPEAILTAIATRLEDNDYIVRSAAIGALYGRSNLPEAIVTAMATRLKHNNISTTNAAIKAAIYGLSSRSILSEPIVTFREALGSPSILPDAILTALAAQLEHEDSQVRYAAIEALGNRLNLPKPIVTAMATRLEDKNYHVRKDATKALGSQLNMLDVVLTAVAAWLGHEKRCAREGVVKVLAVVAQLEHKDIFVRYAAIEALTMATRLEDKDYYVRKAAIKALGSRSNLPEHENRCAREAAIKAILTAITARLEDKDFYVRYAAIEALGRRADLPEAILTAMATRLEDKDYHVRQAAIKALGSRSNLPEAILTTIATRLEDKDSSVREVAARALLRSFHSTLVSRPFVGSLYKVLLRRSFKEQWSWYVKNQMSLIDMPDGVSNAGINNMQKFMDMVNKARPLGIPSLEMIDNDRNVASPPE
ncbi:ARM repeat-containing protein [Thozetella sp. PMI_491]|nr:ARM repeat-containing protein [Thozetella sp. PMI_491]